MSALPFIVKLLKGFKKVSLIQVDFFSVDGYASCQASWRQTSRRCRDRHRFRRRASHAGIPRRPRRRPWLRSGHLIWMQWKAKCQLKKAFQGSETETKEMPGGTEQNRDSLTRGHWFDLQANQYFFASLALQYLTACPPPQVYWPELNIELHEGLINDLLSGTTILCSSSQQLPSIRPLKGFLSWHGTLQRP